MSRLFSTGRMSVVVTASIAIAIALGLSLALGFALAVGEKTILLGIYFALVIALGLVIPVQYLPAVALASAALIPLHYIDVPSLVKIFNPAVMLLLVWASRDRLDRASKSRKKRVYSACYIATCIAFLVSSVLSHNLSSSARWLLSFTICVAVIPGISRRRPGVDNVPAVWAALGAGIGVFAVVERILGSNPVYGRLYDSSAQPVLQVWSAYRATTTLGHPLMNGMFLSISAVFGIYLYLERGTALYLIATLLSIVGVGLTVSRSGLLAFAVGVSVMIGAYTVSLSRRSEVRRSGTLYVIMAFSFFSVLGIIAANSGRLDSGEAMASSEYRGELWDLGIDALSLRLAWGYGPGGLEDASKAVGLYSRGNFENGWLEVLLIGGVIGAALMVFAFAATLVRGWYLINFGAVGALASYITSLGSFNLLPAYLTAHVLLSLLILTCTTSTLRSAESTNFGTSPNSDVGGVAAPRDPRCYQI